MGPDRPKGLSLRALPPIWIILLSALLVTGACGGSEASSSGDTMRVVASLEIFADMVRNVGGDRVEVEALLPSGADPHTFELPPSAVREIAEADVVFINGLGLEGSIEDVIRENASGPVVELTELLNVSPGTNPHLWLDPESAQWYVRRINLSLVDLDLKREGKYHQEFDGNTDRYLDELATLHQDYLAAIGAIPPENRKLVTFHDAFEHLAVRYQMEVVAVVVPSPGKEPSAEDIAELTETIEREDVPAVFKEPQFNSDVLEGAADDAGVRVLDLLSDAYIEGVDSYVELMEFNLAQLVDGLGAS